MKTNTRNSLTVILQMLIALVGAGVLAFMLWEPRLEGVNAGRTLFEVYFKDPFLAYVYISSIAFFTALYQAFKVLGNIRADKMLSPETEKAIRTVKYCAETLVVLILAAMAVLFALNRGQDDITGGVFMGLLAIAGSGTVAAVADRFRKKIYGDHN
jgi:hypothetical protein